VCSAGLDFVRTTLFTPVNGRRAFAQPAVVVFATSQSDNPSSSLQSANALKAQGTTIVTVGVGSVNSAELQAIASQPAGAVIVNSAFNLQPSDGQYLSRITTIAGQACPVTSCKSEIFVTFIIYSMEYSLNTLFLRKSVFRFCKLFHFCLEPL
jgi:hypothetical protein